jgi:transposase
MVSRYDPAAAPTIWRMPDDLWRACRRLPPPEKPPGTRGRPAVPFRRVLDGILHVLRTGCQWKAVPREFGSGAAPSAST